MSESEKKRDVQWSTLLTVPSLLHVHHRKSARTGSLWRRRARSKAYHRRTVVEILTGRESGSLYILAHSFWYEIIGDISIFLSVLSVSVLCECVLVRSCVRRNAPGLCCTQSLLYSLSLAVRPGSAQVINKPTSIGEDARTQTPRCRIRGPGP